MQATATEERKCPDDASDSEVTPVGSPDQPDAVPDPSQPVRPFSLALDLPLRLRSRPPAVRELELSRITEVDTPASLSGVTTAAEDSVEASEEAEKKEKEEEDGRARFLRDFLLHQRDRLAERPTQEPVAEQSGSEPSSLSQHTAVESDLSSTGGRLSKSFDRHSAGEEGVSFKALPVLEPISDTLDLLEGASLASLEVSSVHMSQHPCLTSTMTGEEGHEAMKDWSIDEEDEEEEDSETEVLKKACEASEPAASTGLLSQFVSSESASTAAEAGLAQLLMRSRHEADKSSASLSQAALTVSPTTDGPGLG